MSALKSLDAHQKARKFLHMTVFAQSYSPCGKYLAAANNYGEIALFSLVSALSPESTQESLLPIFTFTANECGAIYCLLSTDTFLLSAGEGNICAWKWVDILSKTPKLMWNLPLPKKGAFSNPEVNSLAFDKNDSGNGRLLAGCGDNNVHVWDIESGSLEVSLGEHEDYIHAISLKNHGRECVSASEDGTCRIWDTRASTEAVHILEPHKHEECSRPEIGKWLGCVAMDPTDDWLVCGGGPHLSMWHMRSLTATALFKTNAATHNCVMFQDDSIISGGSQPCVNHWYPNGELKSEVPCSPSPVFKVAVNERSDRYKVLSVVGSSGKIDVCTNFGYKAFSLLFS